jgi:sialidase-1
MQILHHGVVVQSDGSLRSYYGWPTVARLENGQIVVAASGHRMAHVCPWGRTTLWVSDDQGESFGPTQVAHDSPLDDRDAGVVALCGDRMLLSWFTSDTRIYRDHIATLPQPRGDLSISLVRGWEEPLVSRYHGAFVMAGSVAQGWEDPVEIGITAPHGPIRLEDGRLLYLGKAYTAQDGMERRFRGIDHPRPLQLRPVDYDMPILCCVSSDDGKNWEAVGEVSDIGGFSNLQLHEPHVAQLPGGRLLGIIRTQWEEGLHFHRPFSMASTFSDDGGKTWSPLAPLDVSGSPPHLLVHSSGTIILSYGYRAASEGGPDVGSGQRVLLSRDGGRNWSAPLLLRDDGPDGDLGYPATCELEDGSLLTVYYQKTRAGENCSILSTRWALD